MLLKKNLDYEIHNQLTDDEGNYVIIDIQLVNIDLLLLPFMHQIKITHHFLQDKKENWILK